MKTATETPPLTKSALIERIRLDNPYLTRDECVHVVDAILAALSQQFEAGGRVEIRGFGTFTVRERPSRLAHNPKTLTPVEIGPTRRVHFKPSSTLASRIRDSAG